VLAVFQGCHFFDEEAPAMLSDILQTGFECGVLNGKVEPETVEPETRGSRFISVPSGGRAYAGSPATGARRPDDDPPERDDEPARMEGQIGRERCGKWPQ
jgi:hypothetical protein